MPSGEDLINATKHIPASDKPAFIQGLNAISDELGISRDFLPIIMVTETGVDGTINPAANNGNCGGLIQFCNGNAGAGEVGSNADTISKMSALEQLPLVRQYLSTKGIPKGADLPTTYLSILYPVAMGESRSTNLGYVPPQSEHLYGPGGVLTKETIEAGLLGKAKLGGTTLSSPSMSGDKAFSALPSNKSTNPSTGATGTATLGTNGGSVIIGTYTKDCSKTPPWDWTMQGGKVYRGCALRITTLGIEGGKSSVPMVGAMTTSTTKATVMAVNITSNPNVTPPKPGSILNPVPGSPESSGYGMRVHPITGVHKMHQGTDISAAEGTPIVAALGGVITESRYTNGYGNGLAIKHSDGSIGETFYAHMSRDAGLPVGTQVKAGQIIGYVGSTGMSTGPHLHFEVRDTNGQLVDPNTVMQR